MRHEGCDLVCVVRFLDRELQDVFAGEHLVFSLLEGLRQPRNLQGKQAEHLVHSTTTAIATYLQVA